MANLNKYQGDMYLSDEGNEVIKIVYDFDKDTGAVAFYNGFRAKQKMVVHKVFMKIQTACTSGGSATVSLGQTGSVASLVAATAVASLTANAVIAGVSATGAGGIYLAADDYVGFDIAVAALTAGKIEAEIHVTKL